MGVDRNLHSISRSSQVMHDGLLSQFPLSCSLLGLYFELLFFLLRIEEFLGGVRKCEWRKKEFVSHNGP